jgi:hypothetical protein
MAASVIKRDLFAPEIGRLNHGNTSALLRVMRGRTDASACDCGAGSMNRKNVNVFELCGFAA